jgi:hypothetical protein
MHGVKIMLDILNVRLRPAIAVVNACAWAVGRPVCLQSQPEAVAQRAGRPAGKAKLRTVYRSLLSC